MDKELSIEYPFKKFLSRLYVTKTSDVGYVVTYEIEQYRSLDGQNWEERKVMSNSSSDDEINATAIAVKELVLYLNAVGGDLFNSEIGKTEKKELL